MDLVILFAILAAAGAVAGKPPLMVGYVNLPAGALTMVTSLLGVAPAHPMSASHLRPVFAGTVLLLAGNMRLDAVTG